MREADKSGFPLFLSGKCAVFFRAAGVCGILFFGKAKGPVIARPKYNNRGDSSGASTFGPRVKRAAEVRMLCGGPRGGIGDIYKKALRGCGRFAAGFPPPLAQDCGGLRGELEKPAEQSLVGLNAIS